MEIEKLLIGGFVAIALIIALVFIGVQDRYDHEMEMKKLDILNTCVFAAHGGGNEK